MVRRRGGKALDLSLLKPQVLILIPCFVGGDEKTRERPPPPLPPLSSRLLANYPDFFKTFCSIWCHISSNMHLAPHKGYFLDIVHSSSYYRIHQKFKWQSRRAVGEQKTPATETRRRRRKSGLFSIFIQYHTSTYGGRKLSCSVCS